MNKIGGQERPWPTITKPWPDANGFDANCFSTVGLFWDGLGGGQNGLTRFRPIG